ncbi:hypothetical protein BJF86_02555 [Serinicoccus sp. CNJ-927]|uniref:DUF6270 domain-containing protein n=1 Tax=Serinicoccus sp. CNJ-927 TaxID=1904970 RepID=UPI0009646DB4|nr:DUF6270 domain-containing protein [Serinicoccus sp. CNJ-927]OLT41905.1 hypothetical protein BJF86_02555 [Serinicoccus sp. CNJ-927]
MTVRTFIYGSCVSRDTFERLPRDFELLGYVARQSLVSAFTPSTTRTLPTADTRSDFQRRMITNDWESSLERQLREHADRVDLLLWDLCDERVGLRRLERLSRRPTMHAWATRSVDSIRAGVDAELEEFRLVPFASGRHRVLFLHALRRFGTLLDELGLRQRTLLLAPAWATHTSEGSRVPTSFGLDPARANRLFHDYHSTASQITGVDLVTIHDVAADPHHAWGPAPFHYTDSVYNDLSRRIVEAAVSISSHRQPETHRPSPTPHVGSGGVQPDASVPTSQQETVDDLVHRLVHEPASLWSGERVQMAARQQKMVEKFRTRNGLRDLEEVYETLMAWARERATNRPMTYFVVNPGSAGSHWLQEMMADAGNMNPCGDVYLPPAFMTAGASLGDTPRGLLFDASHLLQAYRPIDQSLKLPLINTAHIRGWGQHQLMPDPRRLILLSRDPLDVVISRTFRKPDYRAQQFSKEDDFTYLQRNIQFVKNFYERGKNSTPDAIVRYEDLRRDPRTQITKLGQTLGVPFAGERALDVDARGGSNKYTGPPVEIPEYLRTVAIKELSELRSRLDYA